MFKNVLNIIFNSTNFIIMFIILWFSNKSIGLWLHPKWSSNHLEWQGAVLEREIMFEYMFLLALFLGIFKSTNLSKALSMFAVVLVYSSLIDKDFYGSGEWAYYDNAVIVLGIISGILIYIYSKHKF